jgi:hypothetical protein
MSFIRLVEDVSSFLRSAFSNQQRTVVNGLKNKNKSMGLDLPYFQDSVIYPQYRPS